MAASTKKKSGASKNTANKKNTSRSGKNSKKSNQSPLESLINSQELKASLIFVTGLILCIIMLFAGQQGTLWNTIHTFYMSVFGLTGYYIPLVTLFTGILNVMNKQKPVYSRKIFEIFLAVVIVCGMIHVNSFYNLEENAELKLGATIGKVYSGLMSGNISLLGSGGVIGAFLGGMLFRLGKSATIANVILVLLLLADLMFLFGITLFKLFSQIEKPARKVTAYTGEAIENAKTDFDNKRKEYVREMEHRKAERKNDPTRIAEKFCNDNPESSDEPGEVNKKGKSVEYTENTPVFAGDFTSIFDSPVKKADAAEASSPPEASPDSLFDIAAKKGNGDIDIFQDESEKHDSGKVIQLDGNGAQEKPVKVNPLTAEEQDSLKSELEGGLGAKPVIEYKMPPLACLNPPKIGEKVHDANDLKANGEKLISALNSFNVQATIVNVVPGPTVTRYELSPAPGVKISKFVGLSDDLALHMAAPAGLRIEAPIPNKAAIGIEIPNKKKISVSFREIIDNDKFKNASSKLNVALGKDIAGDIIFSDIARMPHLLVAGTTGSGKSVCLNTMIMSILYNASPDEVKIILIDPKQVEFGIYNGLPHLLVPVVSDPRKASGALAWAVTEMLSRYKTLNANGVRDIGAYNNLCDEREDLVKMPQIVIFIDELSDLMTVAPAEVEDSIQRLAQMARAAGMHLVVATQRPSVDVITGVIKANIPSRIALTVKSQVDSRTIIDSAGAEKLMGYGDMLYYPVGVPKPIRVQGAFLSDKEIENVVDFIKSNATAVYDDAVQQEIERQAAEDKKKGSMSSDDDSAKLDKNDELLMRAIELFVSAPEKASISALQRHLSLGFAKAGRLMDTLEEKGIVGPTEGSKPRKVLITKAQWYEMNAMSSEVAAPVPEQTSFDSDGFEYVSMDESTNNDED